MQAPWRVAAGGGPWQQQHRSRQRLQPGGLSVRLAQSASRVRADFPLVALDAVLIAASYFSVLLLRFEWQVPPEWWGRFQYFLPFAVLLHLLMNWAWGLYGHMWRYAGVLEARRILLAGMSAGMILAPWFLTGRRHVPVSVLVLGAVLTVMFVGGLRFQSRLFGWKRRADRPQERQLLRVLVIGAGDSGHTLVRDMLWRPDEGLLPVAILDDDPRKQGRSLCGIPILGGLDELARVAEERGAEQAVLAVPSADGALVRRVAGIADAAGLTLKVLPSVAELVGGEVSVRDVRDLSIDDLLGRQQVHTDLAAVRAILRGRRVLITGAGGSIGAEIARQVAACGPAALLLLDHDETHLHDAAANISAPCEQLLVDVRDRRRVFEVFREQRPQVVFHAAAHKHVPLLERHPVEAVATNAFGTVHLVDAAAEVDVERFVFISTDKAVRPASVMGASKRLGELVLLGRAPAGARYCAVRFGNVLGSRGSVIPTFMRQIQQGGPVTVTDPRMTRFFMSIPEAVQLVLQAAALSDGGEIFMLDMGEPIKIVELAERMIRLSGRRVGSDIAIQITGMRPGEKLSEELRSPEERPFPTAHPSVVALYPPGLADAVLNEGLGRLEAAVHGLAADTARSELFDLVSRQPDVVRLRDLVPTSDKQHDLTRSPAWNPSTI